MTGTQSISLDFAAVLERFILAFRTDFGCLCVIVGFVIIMIGSIVFADIITPPASGPFV